LNAEHRCYAVNEKDWEKIDEAFKIETWKIRLFYFNDFIKNVSKNKSFKIILAINSYIWLEGDAKVKCEILKQIEDYY
jgi:hypothetical protein